MKPNIRYIPKINIWLHLNIDVNKDWTLKHVDLTPKILKMVLKDKDKDT